MSKQHGKRLAKAEGCFSKWLRQRPKEEASLQHDAFTYEEEFFGDLTLEDPRVRSALISYRVKGDDGHWYENDVEFDELSIDRPWVFQFRNFRGSRRDAFGICETTCYRILIKKGLSKADTKRVLLHEMIHAYEYMLVPHPGICDWLMIDLYRRMTKKLGQKEVERCLRISTHVFHGDPNHRSLFLLKSLDLDQRHKWKPGTVFGYGREELFRVNQ